MTRNAMILGAAAAVALSVGVPGLVDPDADPPGGYSADLDVEVLEDEEVVSATLLLDPDAPVVDVELWSNLSDFVLLEEGENGVWVAEGPTSPDVDCYWVNARVTLATTQDLKPTKTKKLKKLKKPKKAKATKQASTSAKYVKTKKAKHVKTKKTTHSEDAAPGALVLELTGGDCRELRDGLLPSDAPL